MPGHPKILARDLVELPPRADARAVRRARPPRDDRRAITWEGEGDERVVVLHTDRGELRSRTVIVAGGHGAFEPKKLPGYDLTPWEGRGAHYLVGEKRQFEGKRVVIIGGGDSACDWVVNLLDTAERVALVHRRDGFRAHEATVKEVMDAHGAGHIDLHVPYQVKEVTGNGAIESIRLFHSEDETQEVEIACDAILLQLGFKTQLGPLKEWGFEIEKGAIQVDPLFADLAGARVGLRRHHDVRRQAQAHRHRLRRGGDRRRPGRAPAPARR